MDLTSASQHPARQGPTPHSSQAATAAEQPLMIEFEDLEKRVETPFGEVKVCIYGNRELHPIVTFHDVGMDAENNFLNFFQFSTIAEIGKKFCVYNINAPGQEMDARPLPDDYVYPSMDELAQIVGSVVEHFGFKSFVGMGVGAGANVMIRYALNHQQKVDGLILVNACITRAGWIEWAYQKANVNLLWRHQVTNFTVDYLLWHHFGRHLDECDSDILRQYRNFFHHHPNPRNLAHFLQSYLWRSEITLMDRHNHPHAYLLDVPVLQLVGHRSAFVDDSVHVNSQLDPHKSEWMKISDSSGLVLDDKPAQVTQAIMLFLQGLGYFAAVNVPAVVRKLSISLEQAEAERKGSGQMTQATTVETISETAA